MVGRGMLAAALVAAICGCRSVEPVRWYVLEPTGEMQSAAGDAIVVNVGPVQLAESLDRPHILQRVGLHEIDFDKAARWGEPLADGIARVLAEDLARQLGTEHVGVVPGMEEPEVGWRVTVQVLRFEVEESEAVVEARWRLAAPGEREPTVTQRSEARSGIDGAGAEAAVTALSACLADLARDVARAVATH